MSRAWERRWVRWSVDLPGQVPKITAWAIKGSFPRAAPGLSDWEAEVWRAGISPGTGHDVRNK